MEENNNTVPTNPGKNPLGTRLNKYYVGRRKIFQ